MQPSEEELIVVADAVGSALAAGESVWLELTKSQSLADAHAFADRLETRLGVTLERAQLIGSNGIALAIWQQGAESPIDAGFMKSSK